MSKSFSKFTLPKQTHRQPLALLAKMRRVEKFHDRRAPRGGSRNETADLIEDWDDGLDEVG
jgi:hypothetical protein